MMVDNRLVDRQQIEPVIEKLARALECRYPAYSLCGSWLLRRKSGEGVVTSARTLIPEGAEPPLARVPASTGLPCGRPPDENRWA